MHYEMYPPFPSLGRMAASVLETRVGIRAPGLSEDPEIPRDCQYRYSMGQSGFAEHGAYWNYARLINDLRRELR
jgi:hypothetical protein